MTWHDLSITAFFVSNLFNMLPNQQAPFKPKTYIYKLKGGPTIVIPPSEYYSTWSGKPVMINNPIIKRTLSWLLDDLVNDCIAYNSAHDYGIRACDVTRTTIP